MFIRRLLLNNKTQHVLFRGIILNTPGSTICRNSSNNSSSNDVNLLQSFHDISRRILSRQTSFGRQPKKEAWNNTNTSQISAANLTSNLCRAYLSLPDTSVSQWREKDKDLKQQFLRGIVDDYAVRISDVSTAIKSLQTQSTFTDKTVSRLRELCTPQYEHIFRYILHSANDDLGVAFMVKLRHDILDAVYYMKFVQRGDDQSNNNANKKACTATLSTAEHFNKLQTLESCIHDILTSLFRPGVLNLRRITYGETPAAVIEQIALKEKVHPLQSLNDLRTRLGPGRRCYAFFHPALPQKPLVFVHVSLLQEMPKSMEDIQAGSDRVIEGIDSEEDAGFAAFYSITNTERGLAGVDLGNHLIKSVVKQLKEELPKLKTFCTLSPIPKFNKWLQGKIAIQQSSHDTDTIFTEEEMQLLEELFGSAKPLDSFLKLLDTPKWHEDNATATLIKPILLKLAAYYLIIDTHYGRPLCPVAKFHIRNGAEMFRLNHLADTSSKGMRNSCGVMINYHYSLDEIESNHACYEMERKISIRDGVSEWLNEKPDHIPFK